MDNYLLITREQKELTALMRQIAQKVLEPLCSEMDEKSEFPFSVFHKLCDAGLYGLQIPEKYGGMGLDYQTMVMLHEELGKVDAGFAFAFFISCSNSNAVFHNSTSDEQKQYLADRMLKDHALVSICITEPGAGSDAAAIATTYTKDGDEYVLNGTKCFISGAANADIFIVVASGDRTKGNKGLSLFMVDRKYGVRTGKHEDKLGIRMSDTCEVIFDDVRIPVSCMIGEEFKGFKYIMQYLEKVRFTTMSCGLGGAQAAFDYAVQYAKTRIQFGKPIMANQGISFKLAEMQARLHAARAVLQYAARVADEGLPLSDLSPSAKIISSDTAVWVCHQALQVLGGYGYMKEYPIERHLRNSRIFQIFEGTNEIQKVVISGILSK